MLVSKYLRGGGRSVSVTALRGKVSWQSEAKKYHNVTTPNKSHTRDLLAKTQDVAAGVDEKQQQTKQEEGFI